VVKQSSTAVVRLRTSAGIELAAVDYSTIPIAISTLPVALRHLQLPGSEPRWADGREDQVDNGRSSRKKFPQASNTRSSYNPDRVHPTVHRCRHETIVEAILLVVLVVILFLQTWPRRHYSIVAIPVSLIGTFFFMAVLGFSASTICPLFGLVLAVGIVVDDAIVVVENVERNNRRRPGSA